MNLAILKGYVGQDPKITEFKDGGKVASFTLATSERFQPKTGKKRSGTIVVKKTGLAKVCEQYVKKGIPLLVTGKITNRSYEDNNGQTRIITEILVDELELLGKQEAEKRIR